MHNHFCSNICLCLLNPLRMFGLLWKQSYPTFYVHLTKGHREKEFNKTFTVLSFVSVNLSEFSFFVCFPFKALTKGWERKLLFHSRHFCLHVHTMRNPTADCAKVFTFHEKNIESYMEWNVESFYSGMTRTNLRKTVRSEPLS